MTFDLKASLQWRFFNTTNARKGYEEWKIPMVRVAQQDWQVDGWQTHKLAQSINLMTKALKVDGNEDHGGCGAES